MQSRYLKKWAIVLLAVSLLLAALDRLFPLDLSYQTDNASVVLDKDGRLLRAFANKQGVWRFPITPQQVHPDYLQALFTYEDRYFYYHPGVNPISMIRALAQAAYYGEVVSGGSTITMQVARLLHPNKRSVSGKLYQILRALQLEWHFSKQQILTIYLNIAPFGGTLQGVQAASLTYFDKPASDLTQAEAALLAVLPQSPTRYRPDLHPEVAKLARNKLLQRMADFKVWPQIDVDQLKQIPVYGEYYPLPQIAPILSRRLHQASHKGLYQTFIDRELQQRLAYQAKAYVQSISDEMSLSTIVMHAPTGEVKAYIGSADFHSARRQGQVDMVTATRSPGSTLKPFVYAHAMEQGLIHEMSLLQDVPIVKGLYRPTNFNQGFKGPVSVKQAVLESLNIPVLQVINHSSVYALTARLHNAGADLIWPELATANHSLVLGGVGTQLESLVLLYSAFINQGVAVKPRFSTEQPMQRRFLLNPGSAWIMQNILRQQYQGWQHVTERDGYATSSIGWKTGTSYGYRDAWVIGFKGDYIIGVWLGRPDAKPVFNNTGSQNALPFFLQIAEQLDSQTIPNKPNNVNRQTICWPLGTRLTDPSQCHQAYPTWLLDDVAPPTLSSHLVENAQSLSQAIWLEPDGSRSLQSCASKDARKIEMSFYPIALEAWVDERWQRQFRLPALSPSCVSHHVTNSRLQILSIKPDSILVRRDKSLPMAITLQANQHNTDLFWFLNGEYLPQADEIQLTAAGQYQLVVRDRLGRSDKVVFTLD
ncbi:penicillin-binding protein 1C [Saccharobesus litoralis]|uniref:peptidoglycan glycosyltransferase n=1 Tax=Saccharobesus litoralis TaxID=2172099 RepID=A0A2S0VTF9_9ALTE|nr:penicillin-binding protein 1C [Saccharobesus litoralis]AWB67462.1 penicillin-binding protein 1C [Saccharobesus litoralis]